MNTLQNFNSSVESKIIALREQQVILDSDVAELYGVETKHINQAVSNNPDKFPDGYVFEITKAEHASLRSKFLTLNESGTGRGMHVKYLPKAFTEKGLYMLATILKSRRATETTLEIVETFAKIRELSRTISQLTTTEDKEQQKLLAKRGSSLIADILSGELVPSESEIGFELNLAVLKFKGSVKHKRKES